MPVALRPLPPPRARARGIARAARVTLPLVLVALAGLLAPSCRRPALEPGFDLVRKFPFAAASVETRVLDLGTPEARPRLVEGFSSDRVDARRGEPFVRSRGWRSSVEVVLSTPREVEVRLVCRKLGRWRARSAGKVTVSVTLNGAPVGAFEPTAAPAEHRLVLPAAAIRPGPNLLAFEYRVDGSPEGPPAIAWYRVELAGGAGSGAPRALADRGLLHLPRGSRVDYFLELEPGSALRAEEWNFGGGRLRVSVETDGAPAREVAAIARPPGRRGIDLGVEAAAAAKLSLVAEAGGGEGGDGVTLLAPAIWAPAEPAPRAAASGPAPAADAGPQRRPHLLIYLVDTLRKDHLGCYGYPRPVSPRLDAFAESAVVFDNAIGQSSWTRASVASLFTGLWPRSHGAIGRRDRLAPEAATLAEALSAAGYRSAGFISNANVDRRLGFGQGFEEYSAWRGGSNDINLPVFRWLEGLDPEAPFFLYVHTKDPHDVYAPPEEFRRRLAPEAEAFYREHIAGKPRRQAWPSDPETIRHLLALYDAEIAYNDSSFGDLLDFLEARGLLDSTLVVFLSDHGEEFFDHGGWNHGKNLHAETLDFPLVVKFPGQRAPRRVAAPVQHIDVLPTILEYLGLPAPPGVEGVSFLDLALGEGGAPAGPAPPVYSHLHLDGPPYASIVDGEWKLIQRRAEGAGFFSLLYRWKVDPRETEELSAKLPVRAAVLAAKLEEKLAEASRIEPQEIELDPDLERELKALGYLN